MIKKVCFLLTIVFVSCNSNSPTIFTEEALSEKVYNLKDESFLFKDILAKNKGKKILIDVWASWCRDCLVGLPKIKQIQQDFSEVAYVFLSVDERTASWKRTVEKYNISGQHYNLPKGMKKGDLVRFLKVSWIPRYLVIDENGKILVFKATNAKDSQITKALKS